MILLRSLNVSKEKSIVLENRSNPDCFYAASLRLTAEVLGRFVRLPRVKSVPTDLVMTLTILETNSRCACKAIFRNRWGNKAVSDKHKLRKLVIMKAIVQKVLFLRGRSKTT